MHICLLTWLVKKQKKQKNSSLKEIWEQEEPAIWQNCLGADDFVWPSDAMKEKAGGFKDLSKDEKETFVRLSFSYHSPQPINDASS